MLVKEIIKKVLNYTGNYELSNAIESGEYTTTQQRDIDLLVDCINLTNSNIATNYVKLIKSKKVQNTTGIISYSKVTNEMIFNIISVTTSGGEKVNFTVKNDGIETKKGEVIIKYSYFPADVQLEDSILIYPTKVNERIFVFGVISEYYYAKGVFDEAQIWEEKFKLEMRNIMRIPTCRIIKKRRWV